MAACRHQSHDVTAKDRFAGETIDASGTTVTGAKLNGVNDLRALVAKRPEQFVQTITERLMIYGLMLILFMHWRPQGIAGRLRLD